METYTLYDLNEYIKRVIALNFSDPIWISCEISQCKNVRGNYYLDLIHQNEEGEVIAQNSAMIWYKSLLFIKAKLGELLPSLLKEGVSIKVKVLVEYNERYGLKLIIEDIDPSYTLGQIELNRQKILERLKQEEVIDQNKLTKLPSVIKKIAVISSDQAAGYKDFITHINENPYGYSFAIHLFQAAMQGNMTESEVCAAIDSIKKAKFDVICIIRGGGSKLDLAAFDNFNIGYKIATCKIPVITGIGHEIDQSIADITAHTALKTPTAVADYIINHNTDFESKIVLMQQSIERLANMHIKNARLKMEGYNLFFKSKPKEIIKQRSILLGQYATTISNFKDIHIKNSHIQLKNIDAILQLSDPKNIMKRGFVLVKNDSKYITSVKEMQKIKSGKLEFHDGEIGIKAE